MHEESGGVDSGVDSGLQNGLEKVAVSVLDSTPHSVATDLLE